MSAPRSRRLPISCEACRTRKIRCPRDGPPCSTCIRRGMKVGECEYARQRRRGSTSNQSAQTRDVTTVPLSPLSNPPATLTSLSGSSNDQHLIERVQRLEQLLESQNGTLASSSHNMIDDMAFSSSRRSVGSLTPRSQQATSSRSSSNGSLRVTASGHVRYMPQRLAWDPNSNLPNDTSSFDLQSSPLGPSVNIQTLLGSLPPTGICTELVRMYFSSFASLFHFLHDPTFSRQYEIFLQDAESVRLEWLALLYTVLATAVMALPPDHPILSELSRKRTAAQRMAELSERWRGMALRCLEADQYLWRHSLCTLQCLVLMIYSIGHTHGQTWTLLGLANHLAQSIGCHVDPEGFDISPVEKEERRRCWSALMMLYTNQNTTIGMIGSPRVWGSAGPRPPADINDEDLEGSHPRHGAGRPRTATQMTYLLLKFRLYDVCAEISEKVFSKPEQASMHTIRALDAAICDEQSSWDERYSAGHSLQPHHTAHLNVLYSYSDHLTLLLHRGVALSDSFGDTIRRWSQGRQLESAKRIIRTHAVLETEPDLAPFRWYNRGLGSFHAFHAAIVLFSLMRIDATVQEVCQRYQLLEGCLARLRTFEDSNAMCAKAATILQRLLGSETTGISHDDDAALPDSSMAREPQGGRTEIEERALASPPLMAMPADALDWSAMFNTIETQQWLTPTGFPWDQWNSFLENPGMTANC